MGESAKNNDFLEGSKETKMFFGDKVNTEKSINSAAVIRRHRLERPTCITPKGARTPIQRSTIFGGCFSKLIIFIEL